MLRIYAKSGDFNEESPEAIPHPSGLFTYKRSVKFTSTLVEGQRLHLVKYRHSTKQMLQKLARGNSINDMEKLIREIEVFGNDNQQWVVITFNANRDYFTLNLKKNNGNDIVDQTLSAQTKLFTIDTSEQAKKLLYTIHEFTNLDQICRNELLQVLNLDSIPLTHADGELLVFENRHEELVAKAAEIKSKALVAIAKFCLRGDREWQGLAVKLYIIVGRRKEHEDDIYFNTGLRSMNLLYHEGKDFNFDFMQNITFNQAMNLALLGCKRDGAYLLGRCCEFQYPENLEWIKASYEAVPENSDCYSQACDKLLHLQLSDSDRSKSEEEQYAYWQSVFHYALNAGHSVQWIVDLVFHMLCKNSGLAVNVQNIQGNESAWISVASVVAILNKKIGELTAQSVDRDKQLLAQAVEIQLLREQLAKHETSEFSTSPRANK